MKHRTLRAAVTAVAVAALASTAACGSAGPSGGGSSGNASAWGLTGGDEATFQASFDAWNKAHPDQKIDIQFFANDAYKSKVKTAIGAGGAPTLIFGWGGGILKSYVDAGKVVDLTADVAADPALNDKFLPSVAATGVIDGKTYAMPNNATQPVMVFYNKDLFAQIGAEPPKTWDELMALVPRFNDAGIAPFSVGGQSKWPLLMWEEYLVDRLGGPEVFNDIAAGKPDAWSNPAVIKANTMIQELVDAGGFIKGFSSIATDSNADSALLYTGKAAMYLMGSWAYPSIKTGAPEFVTDDKLGWAPFPTVAEGAGDPANIVGNPANFWSISADASDAQKDAALAYFKEGLMTDDYVKDVIDSGSVPPVAGLSADFSATDSADYLSFVYSLVQDAPNFQLSWDQALSPAQADALLTNLGQLFLKEITPEEFSTAMNATIGS